tara:strand:+ start:914 stop:1261 length:348 start_codon:yes stop_codon:yes gene_type:complete
MEMTMMKLIWNYIHECVARHAARKVMDQHQSSNEWKSYEYGVTSVEFHDEAVNLLYQEVTNLSDTNNALALEVVECNTKIKCLEKTIKDLNRPWHVKLKDKLSNIKLPSISIKWK